MHRRVFLEGTFIAALLGCAVGLPVHAADYAYAVSWFHVASAALPLEKDCPHGLNPSSDQNYIRWLRELGKSPQEIAELAASYPQGAATIAAARGRVDGQPANVYVNPTTVTDPVIQTVQGSAAFGFNLDGRADTGKFSDPDSGETGVDNELFRALGCIASERGEPSLRPTHTAGQWEINRLQAPAWIVVLKDVDDLTNDPEIVVELLRANDPVQVGATGEALSDVTFAVDMDQVTRNVVKGRIVKGVVSTEVFNLHMISHRYSILPEVDMRKARLRATLSAAGNLEGYIGGYIDWVEMYAGLARRGDGYETGVGIDVPAIYYALRRLADAEPDPSNGRNQAISGTFRIEAVPAFISHSPPGEQAR